MIGRFCLQILRTVSFTVAVVTSLRQRACCRCGLYPVWHKLTRCLLRASALSHHRSYISKHSLILLRHTLLLAIDAIGIARGYTKCAGSGMRREGKRNNGKVDRWRFPPPWSHWPKPTDTIHGMKVKTEKYHPKTI